MSGILAGDEGIYYSAVESGGGKQKMCRVLEEKYKSIRAEAEKNKDAEFALERAEYEKQHRADEILLEAKNAELAGKDAEIARLKAELAARG